MVAPIVRDFLDERRADFTETSHYRAPLALSEAQKDHTPPSEMVKTVVVRIGGGYILAALAADTRIDWPALAHILGTADVWLAGEGELEALFPEVETGAVPPLGPLFDLPVYVDSRLAAQDRIAFSAGSHTNTIHMSFAQFVQLAEPRICSFSIAEH